MRNWKILAVLLAFAVVVPATSYGQGEEDLQKQINELKAEITQLRQANAADADADLEESINALAARFNQVEAKGAKIEMGGEFRFRSAWAIGDNFAGNDYDGHWTDARVRLRFGYTFTDDVTGVAELQSNWAFGQYGLPNARFEPLNDVQLYQGYLHFDRVFGVEGLSNRTGRQEFVIGNQFHFGNADWYNGWSLDGTVWTYMAPESQKTRWAVKAFGFKLTSTDNDLNQISSFTSGHDDSELFGVYLMVPVVDAFKVDLYWVYVNGHGLTPTFSTVNNFVAGGLFVPGQGVGTGATAYAHALGARFYGDLGILEGLDYNVEGTYQIGEINGNLANPLSPGTSLEDVQGFSVEAEIGLRFTPKDQSNIRAFVRFLYAEGPDGDETGYIPLFPNRHANYSETTQWRARYGFFDLLPMDNVINIGGGVTFDPAQQWTLGIAFFYSLADQELPRLGAAGTDDEYGFELDLFAEYRWNEQVTLSGGFSWLEAGDALQSYWNGLIDDDSHFIFWMQARLLF